MQKVWPEMHCMAQDQHLGELHCRHQLFPCPENLANCTMIRRHDRAMDATAPLGILLPGFEAKHVGVKGVLGDQQAEFPLTVGMRLQPMKASPGRGRRSPADHVPDTPRARRERLQRREDKPLARQYPFHGAPAECICLPRMPLPGNKAVAEQDVIRRVQEAPTDSLDALELAPSPESLALCPRDDAEGEEFSSPSVLFLPPLLSRCFGSFGGLPGHRRQKLGLLHQSLVQAPCLHVSPDCRMTMEHLQVGLPACSFPCSFLPSVEVVEDRAQRMPRRRDPILADARQHRGSGPVSLDWSDVPAKAALERKCRKARVRNQHPR
eukprot:scaffold2930_cov244-Pinguiococcus_pyrenoidosus.AAC.1